MNTVKLLDIGSSVNKLHLNSLGRGSGSLNSRITLTELFQLQEESWKWDVVLCSACDIKVLLFGSLSLSGSTVSGHCLVQLHGIGLQEFACICLYNVIKGFLGPTASE